MPSAETLTSDSRFTGLFVGPKHSGKTVAAASFPKPMEIEDFDGRIRGLLGAQFLDRKGISYDFFPPREVGENSPVTKINKKLEGWLVASRVGQFALKTVVLDSLTSECYAMLVQSMSLTHRQSGKDGPKTGKYIGPLAMSGPEDYGFEAQATYDILSCLRSIPMNLIATAHIVDRYGKIDVDNPFSESVVVGKKLSLRDKIGQNIGIYFDHIFEFDRRMEGGHERFFVSFRSSVACTSFAELPEGEFDITGKNFYDFMNGFLKSNTPTTTV